MGQQQLLLVILVTIIVGIATVVAINTFSSSADSANLDAVRQDLASIAASAQGYYMKPTMLGGGGNKFDNFTFSGVSVPGKIFDPGTDLIITNANGTYKITSAADDELKITAHPASDDSYVAGTGSATNPLYATIVPDGISISQ